MTHRRIRPFAMAACLAVAAVLQFAGVASADLGDCVDIDGFQPHQGGNEHDPPSTARGVSGVITVRTPDLCNNPTDPELFDSASTAYVMLNNLGDGVLDWYQVGYVRRAIDASCSRRIYSQRRTAAGQNFEVYGPCATAGVKYRFRIERETDGFDIWWRTYVLVESTQAVFWEGPQPAALGFTIEDTQYSSEVFNEHDQSGGGNLSRLKIESAYWKNSTNVWVPANIPAGADRLCDLCPTPYNSNWLTNRAFEVWTDGF